MAAQLGIVLESLQVLVVQNPSQGKTENRNNEDALEYGKVGSELMVKVKKEPEVDSIVTQLREMIDSFCNNSIGRNGNSDLTKNDIIPSQQASTNTTDDEGLKTGSDHSSLQGVYC